MLLKAMREHVHIMRLCRRITDKIRVFEMVSVGSAATLPTAHFVGALMKQRYHAA